MRSDHRIVCETERLILRIATLEDADLFHALWTSPQVMTNVGFPQGLRIERSEIENRLSKQRDETLEQLLVVEVRATDQPIGEAYLSRPSDAGVAEPDVKLLPRFWGHRYGTEAWRALVAYQFEHTDCEVVQGTPNVHNSASIRMQESAGAVRVGEGVHQFGESMRDFTTPVHHYIYQVHRSDWERGRRAQSVSTSKQDTESLPPEAGRRSNP